MEVVPYKAEHLMTMSLQPAQAWLSGVINYDLAKALESGNALTGLDGDEVLICAGIAPYWEGRGLLWSYIGSGAFRHWKSIHAAAKRFIELHAPERLEASVDYGHAAGRRWLGHLGFEVEVPRARKFQAGRDCVLFVRIKE